MSHLLLDNSIKHTQFTFIIKFLSQFCFLSFPVLQYNRLRNLAKELQPYEDLWTTTSNWLRWHESWLNDPLVSIDSEELDRSVSDAHKTIHKCVKLFKDLPGNYHLLHLCAQS